MKARRRRPTVPSTRKAWRRSARKRARPRGSNPARRVNSRRWRSCLRAKSAGTTSWQRESGSRHHTARRRSETASGSAEPLNNVSANGACHASTATAGVSTSVPRTRAGRTTRGSASGAPSAVAALGKTTAVIGPMAKKMIRARMITWANMPATRGSCTRRITRRSEPQISQRAMAARAGATHSRRAGRSSRNDSSRHPGQWARVRATSMRIPPPAVVAAMAPLSGVSRWTPSQESPRRRRAPRRPAIPRAPNHWRAVASGAANAKTIPMAVEITVTITAVVFSVRSHQPKREANERATTAPRAQAAEAAITSAHQVRSVSLSRPAFTFSAHCRWRRLE